MGPVNIGNPTEFTIRQLADVVKEVVQSDVRIEFTPLTPDDPRQRKPDITKAKRLLNWEPSVELRDGLRLMAQDFKKRVANEDADGW